MTVKFRSKSIARSLAFASAVAALAPASAVAQASQAPNAKPAAAVAAAAPAAVPAPVLAAIPDYLIGAEDVLSIVFWRDKEMSTEVAVRPDGKITLPLLNEVRAAGLTPGQLKDMLVEESKKYVEDPNVTVVVKQINSRKVFITGEVGKPGPYPLMAPTTVMQLIVVAGGLRDYAHSEKISIMRTENGKPTSYRFNYKDFVKNKNLKQNIDLKPGDTIIVP
ncbi:MAG: kpsD 1 [Acidobacteria bacterium]|nr:kpsD 1 [Acidobacteriota bacterium]